MRTIPTKAGNGTPSEIDKMALPSWWEQQQIGV
jgi:hypothetical protein